MMRLRQMGGWYDGEGTLTEILGQQLQLSGAEELTRPYSECVWVKLCIKILGTAMLQAPIRVYRGDPLVDESASDAIDNGPIAKLLASPNDHQSQSTFRYADLTHWKLDGETVWFLMDKMGRPAVGTLPISIVPVRGHAVEIRFDERGMPSKYIYPSSSRIEFPAAAVVHFRDYDPDRPLRGVGDVEVLLRELAQDFAAQRYQEGLLANGGQPGGFVVSKTPMAPERRKQEEAKLRDRTQSASNAGSWHLIDGKEIEIVSNTMAPKDLEYAGLREWVRNVCAPMLGVPLPLLGISEHLTYDNLGHAQKMLWTGGNGIISYLRAWEDTVNTFFLPRLREGQGLFVRHDLSVVPDLQEDLTSKLEAAARIAGTRVGVSFNAAATKLGVDDDLPPEGNTVLFPAGVQTLDTVLNPPEPEVADEGPEEAEPESDSEPEKALVTRDVPESALEGERVRDKHEPTMRAAMRKYLRAYEQAQIKRITSFAERGNAALEKKLPDGPTWIAGLTDEDLADFLLDPEEWIGKLEAAATPVIKASFFDAAGKLAERYGASGLTAQDPRVLSALQSQAIKLSHDVTGTLERKVRRALVNVFQNSGTGVGTTTIQEAVKKLLPELNEELRRVFKDRDARALAIARTEVGRSTSTARFMQAREVGVTHLRWITSGDEAVRDSHAALDGETRALGDEFKPRLRYPRDPEAPASEVVNCFPAGTLMQGRIVGGLRAFYEGPAVEIVTASGHRLTITAQHRVLTAEGLRPAASIRVGEYVLGDAAKGKAWKPRGRQDQKYAPIPVEQVFHALNAGGAACALNPALVQLHGDELLLQGEVEVVSSNRELLGGVQPKLRERGSKRILVGSSVGFSSASGDGPCALGTERVSSASASLPRRRELSSGHRGAVGRGPLQPLRIGVASQLDSKLSEEAKNRPAVNAAFAGELIRSSAGMVALDKVVGVRKLVFSGHVYDLQSEVGWIVADGVICSNCRCEVEELFMGEF